MQEMYYSYHFDIQLLFVAWTVAELLMKNEILRPFFVHNFAIFYLCKERLAYSEST